MRTEEIVAAIECSIEEDPNQSISHHAHQLDMCPSTLWKVLRKDLGLCAYKIQLVNGNINKQNCCILSEENPQVYVEVPLHPEKLTV